MVDKAEPLQEAVQVVSTTSHKKDRNLDMADPLLVCKEGTGVLVSRLRVTEDIANPQNCSLKCPQKPTLLAQWQWLATEWVEPRVLRLHRARATLLQILWLTAYKAAAAARVPWMSFHRFLIERYIQDYKHQLAKSELSEQPIRPQD